MTLEEPFPSKYFGMAMLCNQVMAAIKGNTKLGPKAQEFAVRKAVNYLDSIKRYHLFVNGELESGGVEALDNYVTLNKILGRDRFYFDFLENIDRHIDTLNRIPVSQGEIGEDDLDETYGLFEKIEEWATAKLQAPLYREDPDD